jgi:uncharacterized protein YndB with AHSA1/START domain
MFLKLVLAASVAVALVCAVIAMQPGQYTVARSTTVAAPPAPIYELVSDFHHWNAWSPWAKLDPAMQEQYSGPPSGVGAGYSWQGNSKAGEGRMTIREAVPNEKVVLFLEFLKPFPSSSDMTLSLQPEGQNTRVNWTMTGEATFATKAIQLFSSLDKMVGPDFEKGLAQLKREAEAAAHVQPAASH